jgi:hypothetical protein
MRLTTLGLAMTLILLGNPNASAQEAATGQPDETRSGAVVLPGPEADLSLDRADSDAAEPLGEPVESPAVVEGQESGGKKSIWKRYTEFFDKELGHIGDVGFWGAVTSQLPKGYVGINYTVNIVGAGGFYGELGEREHVLIPPIELDLGPGIGGFKLDLRPRGGAQYHGFTFSYGITGNFDFFLDMSWIDMVAEFDPILSSQGILPSLMLGCESGKCTKEHLFATLERLGHPRPALRFSTNGWEMGDTSFGFSWNPYKSKYFAMSLTLKVMAPTGKIADPDRQLELLLGPEIDRGSGGWGIGMLQGYDVRFPGFMDFLTMSFQTDWMVNLPQKRRLPHFLKQDIAFKEQLISKAAAVDADAAAEVKTYLDSFFPDLFADSGKTFTVVPGLSWGAEVSANIDLAALGASVGYGYRILMPATIRDLPPAAAAAIGNLRAVVGTTEHHLSFGIGTGALMAAYIPAVIKVGYDWMFAGSNALYLSPNWKVGVSLYLPINAPKRKVLTQQEKDLRKAEEERRGPFEAIDPRW